MSENEPKPRLINRALAITMLSPDLKGQRSWLYIFAPASVDWIALNLPQARHEKLDFTATFVGDLSTSRNWSE
jgi:hypothetical protein